MRRTPMPPRRARLKDTPLERTSELRRLRAPGTPARTDRGWNSSLKPGKPLKARKVSKRFAKRRSPAYCAWIRTLPCVLAGLSDWWVNGIPIRCNGRVECAHVVSRGAGGFDVANTVPACVRHHRQSHTMGQQSFQRFYGLDLAAIAAALPTRYEQEQAA